MVLTEWTFKPIMPLPADPLVVQYYIKQVKDILTLFNEKGISLGGSLDENNF